MPWAKEALLRDESTTLRPFMDTFTIPVVEVFVTEMDWIS
jgi:hypothetical protein